MSTTQPIKNMEQLDLFEGYYKQVKISYRNYTMIVIGLNTALRISDILHLTYGDVFDFQKKEWKKHIVIKEQKTKKTTRIYINKEVKETLELYSSYTTHIASDWLFKSQMSATKPLSRYQAFRIIKEAATYAGLDAYISCHSLRKTFGYHAWKKGVPPAMLMDIYNHSSYRITKRYLCIDQEDRDEVFEQICL